MIDTEFNRKLGKRLHDNKVLEGKHKDALELPHLTDVAKAPRVKPLSLKDKVGVFKTYNKQVPVIGGNGEPSVEQEDFLSGPVELRKRMLGGNKSNTSFSKALAVADGLEQAKATDSGLKPIRRAKKVIEGSVPLPRKQLLQNKLSGGNLNTQVNEAGPLASKTVKRINKGDLPTLMPAEQLAEPVKLKADSLNRKGGAKASKPSELSWNELVKKVCSDQKCNLASAINHIKSNNLYVKKSK